MSVWFSSYKACRLGYLATLKLPFGVNGYMSSLSPKVSWDWLHLHCDPDESNEGNGWIDGLCYVNLNIIEKFSKMAV